MELDTSAPLTRPHKKLERNKTSINWKEVPWWLIAISLIILGTGFVILSQDNFNEAFNFIKVGVVTTITTTIFAFLIAVVLGLITGIWRISQNVVLQNLATLYVEFIRGIPMMVLIFFIALVGVPALVGAINVFGAWLGTHGFGADNIFTSFTIKSISMNLRAIIALSITYGAFLAEIFRAGIQSIDKGQMEAARSQGMSYWQSMRYIILPQAIRNVLPALGNDFVSMLKDSSLVSILAVRDITQVARLYAGQSFRFSEAYTTLAIMYLTITLALSLLLKVLERRMNNVHAQ